MEGLDREKEKYREKFEDLIARFSKGSGYECLVCFSGGKDSTYTLDLLKNHYGLRILAVTMDNGFISPVAMENIRRMVESLGVDHIFFKPRFDLLKQIFAGAATEVFYSGKTLQRASTICTSCISIVKFTALRMAIEQEIPFVGYGWSPGQAPIQSSVMRTNPSLIRAAQKSVQVPLVERFGHEGIFIFLRSIILKKRIFFPITSIPLPFLSTMKRRFTKGLVNSDG